MAGWRPTLGAIVHDGVTTFCVWSPAASRVEVLVEPSDAPALRLALARRDDGTFVGQRHDLVAGTRYAYLVDGAGPFPDPASRCQPDGVHGFSMTVEPGAFAWSDQGWSGVALSDLVLYELHVGTFTPSGTFAGVTDRLRDLSGLGITAIELMPVADFPGTRNWGYDGVSLFAPARCYGSPDDLRRLVDRAHELGLGVILDVVYNHAGPDGWYLSRFSPYYFSSRHTTPWGAGFNFDDEQSAAVREFFVENALHWIREYHMDGLRLDATHSIADDGVMHFVEELADRVHRSVRGRHVHVMAEDDRNLATMVMPRDRSGWGLDAMWADDFHHQLRRRLAGDADGYYRDYSGTTADVAATIRQGWFYTGQHSEHLDRARGSDPSDVDPARFVLCLQNHDQVGNRAFGDRLHQEISLPAYRAASVLLLVLPQTPLLFMGQEWAASSPFLYFTDHGPELGRLITEGRRREFRSFAAFASDADRARIPDPQAASTYLASRLDWTEREREPHASTLRLYQTLLAFRRLELAPGGATDAMTAEAVDADTLVLGRRSQHGDAVLIVVRLEGSGAVDLRGHPLVEGAARWAPIFTSEDAPFAPAPVPPDVDCADAAPLIRFAGPAAVVLRGTPAAAGSRTALRRASRVGPGRPR